MEKRKKCIFWQNSFFCIFEQKKLFSILCVKTSRESSVIAEILQFIEWVEKPNKSAVIWKNLTTSRSEWLLFCDNEYYNRYNGNKFSITMSYHY